MIDRSNIVISHHAAMRMRERFRLYFKASHFIDLDATKRLMRGQLITASECIKWKQVPFWVNMTMIEHGDITVYNNGAVYYIVIPTPSGGGVCRTVVPRWLGESI